MTVFALTSRTSVIFLSVVVSVSAAIETTASLLLGRTVSFYVMLALLSITLWAITKAQEWTSPAIVVSTSSVCKTVSLTIIVPLFLPLPRLPRPLLLLRIAWSLFSLLSLLASWRYYTYVFFYVALVAGVVARACEYCYYNVVDEDAKVSWDSITPYATSPSARTSPCTGGVPFQGEMTLLNQLCLDGVVYSFYLLTGVFVGNTDMCDCIARSIINSCARVRSSNCCVRWMTSSHRCANACNYGDGDGGVGETFILAPLSYWCCLAFDGNKKDRCMRGSLNDVEWRLGSSVSCIERARLNSLFGICISVDEKPGELSSFVYNSLFVTFARLKLASVGLSNGISNKKLCISKNVITFFSRFSPFYYCLYCKQYTCINTN